MPSDNSLKNWSLAFGGCRVLLFFLFDTPEHLHKQQTDKVKEDGEDGE